MSNINDKTLNQNDTENNFRKRLITFAVLLIPIGFLFLIIIPSFFSKYFPFLTSFALIFLAWQCVKEIGKIEKGRNQEKLSLLSIFFAIYIFIALGMYSYLIFSENGFLWLIVAIIGVAFFDSFSYLIGKTVRFFMNFLFLKKFIKKQIKIHKMVPTISPKKTWEGAVGGFIACLIAVGISGKLLLLLDFWQIIITGTFIAVLAFLGDLFESFYKRKMEIKDSGSVLPGHGGLLDRIDSALLVIFGIILLKLIF
ncbi:MAG: phosphatidate cytidylyltransferase [Candidatus Nealsonbacteria bacterium]|nr:phosphatidate cytidylyltransferase [Candidatus Nealsonbacteria bacterium]